MHACLLLLDLLDDEERGIKESIDAVLQARRLRSAELSRETAGDTSMITQSG